MEKELKRLKGITLIALTITIVVLIILTAVVINLSVGENGIYRRTKEAKEKQTNAQVAENKQLTDAYGQMLIASGGDVVINYERMEQIILDKTYPVGSIYITIEDKNPSETLGGEWESVSSGRVLQGADTNHSADTTIEAGLPNITGFVCNSLWAYQGSGAFYSVSHADGGHNNARGVSGTHEWDTYMNASRSSAIYGKSNTVQPPAYVVHIWKRTA